MTTTKTNMRLRAAPLPTSGTLGYQSRSSRGPASSIETDQTPAADPPANPRVLITGGYGQLGGPLSKLLRHKFGRDNVLVTDTARIPKTLKEQGPHHYADVLDRSSLQDLVVTYDIDWIIHFGSIVSTEAENNPALAMRVNIEGLHNVLEVSRKYNLKLFVPSTIGAFGDKSPKNNTPDVTIQRPSTIYGVSKVHAEILGEYYNSRFGVDFRCLRFPSIISNGTPSTRGVTVYCAGIFWDALRTRRHTINLRPDTYLPVMYIDDCLRAVCEFMEIPDEQLKLRTYNIHALSVCPQDMVAEVRKYIPDLEVIYKPDERQIIADTWPRSLDDSGARTDWAWSHSWDLSSIVHNMMHRVAGHLGVDVPVRGALCDRQKAQAKVSETQKMAKL